MRFVQGWDCDEKADRDSGTLILLDYVSAIGDQDLGGDVRGFRRSDEQARRNPCATSCLGQDIRIWRGTATRTGAELASNYRESVAAERFVRLRFD